MNLACWRPIGARLDDPQSIPLVGFIFPFFLAVWACSLQIVQNLGCNENGIVQTFRATHAKANITIVNKHMEREIVLQICDNATSIIIIASNTWEGEIV
jgi:hypothetical protein